MFLLRNLFSAVVSILLTTSAHALDANPKVSAKVPANVSTVILISVDGLGADLLSEVPHEDLMNLRASEGPDQGVHAADRALTILPTTTLPAHTSMLSGVTAERHHVLSDQHDAELKKVDVPTIFDLVKQNQLTSSIVVGKEKLYYLFDTGVATWLWNPIYTLFGDAPARFPSVITQAATHELSEHKPNFIFVHYAAVDTIGHAFKWGGVMQKLAVRRTLAGVELLVNEAHIDLEGKSYAVIITADHGGHDGGHGQTKANGELENPNDQEIPWLLLGANFIDPHKTVQLIDTAPTIAHLLGLEVPKAWHWQGENVAQ